MSVAQVTELPGKPGPRGGKGDTGENNTGKFKVHTIPLLADTTADVNAEFNKIEFDDPSDSTNLEIVDETVKSKIKSKKGYFLKYTIDGVLTLRIDSALAGFETALVTLKTLINGVDIDQYHPVINFVTDGANNTSVDFPINLVLSGNDVLEFMYKVDHTGGGTIGDNNYHLKKPETVFTYMHLDNLT